MFRSFSSPIDASRYNAALGMVAGIVLLAIDYEAGTYRWQAADAAGNPLSPDVFGTNVTPGTAAEIAADAHIRADIARTLV
jgi:hypothetical protein